MIRFFINQHKAVNLVFLLIIGFGILTFIYGRKEGFPNVGLNLVVITTTYPGASADIIEELVTDKIESEIDSIEGGDRIVSFSSEGRSVIRFEIETNTSRLDTEIGDDIKTAISRLEFPEDVKQPIVEVLNFENTTINIVTGFIGNVGNSIAELEAIKSIANRFKDDLKKIPGVGRVELLDYPNLEIWVEIDPAKLRFHELELDSVINAIRARNLNVSAGKINLKGKEFFIKTSKKYQSLGDIENTIVRGNDTGQYIFLKDVAAVRWAHEELTSYKRYNGKSGVWINVYKASKGDSITISAAVEELLNTYRESGLVPRGVEAVTIDDLSVSVKSSLNILSSNATIGLILVFLCMILFFSFRITFVTILGIPFSFCLAVILMYAVGLTLNIVSMFGLIIVVGMIVDDSIIVAENVYAHSEKRKSFYQAALDGTHEMLIPVLAVISTTTLAFLPLTTLPGILGDVLGAIPQAVIITLFCSLLECVIVLPGHLAHIKNKPNTPDPEKTSAETPAPKPKRRWFIYLNDLYEKFLTKTLKKPLITAVVFIAVLISAALLMGRTIPFVFFPGDAENIVANIETDIYNQLKTTQKIIDEAESKIRAVIPEHYVVDIVSTVGVDGTVDGDDNKTYQPYIGAVRITLETSIRKDDAAIVRDIQEAIADIDGITKQTVSVIKGGPPVGKPIDVYITGSRNADVITAAQAVQAFINTLSNVTSISSSYEEGKEIVNINPNEGLAAILNIDLNSVANSVSNAFAETASTTITSLDDFSTNENELDLIVKYAENEEKVVQDIYNTPIRNQKGLNIPLKNLSEVEFQKSSTLLAKENGEFYISVSAFLVDETSLEYDATTLIQMINEKISEWSKQFPNVSFVFKGQQEEEEEQSTSLIRAFFLAIFGIYFVLTVVFRSYIQPFVVMSIIPLGFVGVILGLFLTNTPLGLMPFLGGVALMGIVVNDSLVMVDRINRLRRQDHLATLPAVIQGAKSRMRPILMTSLTTVVGIAPLAYGFAGYDPFLGAMAISLMWGIIASTALLLILLPSFYLILDNFMCFLYKRFKKEYTIVDQHSLHSESK